MAMKAAPAPKTTKSVKPATAAAKASSPAKSAPAAKTAATPKAAPAAAKAPTVPTVTMKHIAAELATEHDMPRRQADAMLVGMVDRVVDHLKKGDRIRIGGLGILQVKKRAARIGRNPATGEQIKIKASKKVAFRPAKELKESI